MVPAAPFTSTADLPIRELRRSDRDAFLVSIEASYGAFETMIGLRRDGGHEFRSVFSPGIWFLFRLLRAVGRPPVHAYVAVDGDVVAGTTLVLPWTQSGYILGVGVQTPYRRRGLAGRLVGRAEDQTRRSGKPWAVLDVEEENHPAVSLYLGRQYTQIQKALWFRTESPQLAAGVPHGAAPVREVSKRSDRTTLARWVATQLPPSIASILPPAGSRLTHLEAIAQSPRTARNVWAVGPAEAPHGVLTAVWRGSMKPGILFLAALSPGASRDETVSLIQAGIAWLVGKGSGELLLAVPDLVAGSKPLLAELGFQFQMTTLAMAKPLGTISR